MSLSNLQARRATVDDLVELRGLWQKAGWPASDLEKQLTDFQVVETPDGVLLGALALQIHEQQGRLHSVACRDSENVEKLLEKLWNRVHALARNHGLCRIWTREEGPFWRSLGFEHPTPELQDKPPAAFGAPQETWLVLKLRDEPVAGISLERELEILTQAGRESSERLLRQAKVAKRIAYLVLVIAVLVGVVVIASALLPRSFWEAWFNRSRARTPVTQPPALATNAPPPKP